jgi:excisionase family DNA binding protein
MRSMPRNYRNIKSRDRSNFAGARKNRLWQEAARLGVSEKQVRDWMDEKVIPYTQIGGTILFDPVKVDAALARYEREVEA